VQHEVLPGMALDVGYFRRAWAHFRVTDNLLASPADYTRFDIVAPSNPNLPGGGGYTITVSTTWCRASSARCAT
jgi:hypothetical protein